MLLIFTGLTIATYGFLGVTRPSLAEAGLEEAGGMLLQALPWMLVSMLAAGIIAQFIDPRSVAKWLGEGSGFWGIVFGATLGIFGTGSRWAVYPLAASLMAADARLGAIFAFTTSWQLVSVPRLPAEIPFFGLPFTILRACTSFLVAIVGGVLIDLWTRL